EDGIRDWSVTGVQTCALPIYSQRPGNGIIPQVPNVQISIKACSPCYQLTLSGYHSTECKSCPSRFRTLHPCATYTLLIGYVNMMIYHRRVHRYTTMRMAPLLSVWHLRTVAIDINLILCYSM